MSINRRTVLTGAGFATLAGALAACGSSTSTASSSSSSTTSSASSSSATSSSSGATSHSSATSNSTASASASGTTNNGYQVNTFVAGAPVVTLYTDYQCPYCKQAEPAFEAAAKTLDGKINVTVKNFPLPMHTNAIPAAIAVMAAQQQGKRMEYSDKLFSTQSDWEKLAQGTTLNDKFTSYASELGLDTTKFASDLSNADLKQLVTNDFNEAMSLKLRGTPSFVFGGKSIDGVTAASTTDQMVAGFKKAAGIS